MKRRRHEKSLLLLLLFSRLCRRVYDLTVVILLQSRVDRKGLKELHKQGRGAIFPVHNCGLLVRLKGYTPTEKQRM